MTSPAQDFGFMLREISRLYVARFSQLAERLSLSLSECRVLTRLEVNPGVTQAQLAKLIDVDPMTIVRILDRMEERSLLVRRADSSDRRLRRIFLTTLAKGLLHEVRSAVDLTDDAAFENVSAAQRAEFLRIMEQIHCNLSGLERSTARPSCNGSSTR